MQKTFLDVDEDGTEAAAATGWPLASAAALAAPTVTSTGLSSSC